MQAAEGLTAGLHMLHTPPFGQSLSPSPSGNRCS